MPAENEIFGPYNAGFGNFIHADPFRIRRLMGQILPPELANRLLDDGSPAAIDQFLQGVCTIFAIAPFDPATGQGATEDAIIDVWNAWQDFCEQKKTIVSTSPTSSTASPVLPPLPAWAQKLGSASS